MPDRMLTLSVRNLLVCWLRFVQKYEFYLTKQKGEASMCLDYQSLKFLKNIYMEFPMYIE